jgi:phage tail-like protein
MVMTLLSLLDPEQVYRFQVIVEDMYFATFTEFKIPDLEVQTMDVIEGGQNAYVHKLPVRVNTGPVVLKRGVTADMSLIDWYMQVAEGKVKDARRQVSVVTYSAMGIPMMMWSFLDAYPVKWVGPSFNAGDSSVALEELHFVHHGFTVESISSTIGK